MTISLSPLLLAVVITATEVALFGTRPELRPAGPIPVRAAGGRKFPAFSIEVVDKCTSRGYNFFATQCLAFAIKSCIRTELIYLA